MIGLIKKIVITVILLLVLAGVGLYFGVDRIAGDGVAKAFNRMGPEITGTDTYIDGVNVNVFGADVTIDGLFIGNPEGFSKPSAMTCEQIYVDIEPGTLFSDEIVVNEIRVVKPKFTFEQTLVSNNLTKLKAQIDANTRRLKKEKPVEEEPGDPVEEAQKKTIRLNHVVVNDGSVDVAVLSLSRELPLPQIERDFGGEGVTPAEAADYVLSVIIEKVVEEAIKLAAEYSDDPAAIIQDITGGDTADAVEKTTEAIKGLFE